LTQHGNDDRQGSQHGKPRVPMTGAALYRRIRQKSSAPSA
jgi:hypothetical protein